MVTLPPAFIATRYPGYFWNYTEQRLYSCKVSGVLTPMKLQGRWHQYPPGYSISVEGSRRRLSLEQLKELKPKHSVFPVKVAP